MRIAFVVHGYPPEQFAGVELVAKEQAEALVCRGHEVAVFARCHGQVAGERSEVLGGVRVRRVAPRPEEFARLEHSWRNTAFDGAFERFLDEERPDVVHAQHLVLLSPGLLRLAAARGVPTVLSLHDVYFFCHRLHLLDDRGERCPGPDEGARCEACLAGFGGADVARDRFETMMRRVAEVDRLLAPSHALVAQYEQAWPFLAGRIEVADPGIVQPATASAGGGRERAVPGEPLRLLFAGAWLPHKGLDLLVRALTRLDPSRWSLVVVGTEVAGEEAFVERLRALAAGLPVEWRGAVPPEAMAAEYARADVLVLPSRCDESYSRVVREARAAGLAVVAPETGGPAEVLVDGRDALLVAPGSQESLDRALARLVGEPGLARRLAGQPARFPTPGEAAARLEALYRELLVGVAGPGAAAGRAGRAPRPRVSVAYVTKNGDALLDGSLAAVRRQVADAEVVEILAVDSGSTDGTLDVLARHGARVLRIPPHEFGHGRTRNLAAHEARGDIVVFLTQDAAPADETWLARLLEPLLDDPLVAGAWSRHVARPGCHPMECRRIEEFPLFHGDRVVVSSSRGGRGATGALASWFSNNSSAIRRDVLLRWPFPEVEFAEDQAWARAVLAAGFRTALANDSRVLHSHPYSPWTNLQRHFDHARAMREVMGWHDDPGIGAALRGALREARRDVSFWARRAGRSPARIAARWGVPAAAYHLGGFGGSWLAARADRLPAAWRRRLSLHDRLRGIGADPAGGG